MTLSEALAGALRHLGVEVDIRGLCTNENVEFVLRAALQEKQNEI